MIYIFILDLLLYFYFHPLLAGLEKAAKKELNWDMVAWPFFILFVYVSGRVITVGIHPSLLLYLIDGIDLTYAIIITLIYFMLSRHLAKKYKLYKP